MPVEEVCMSIAFPNESREYREARDALLQREIDLRRQMEAVEAQRRSLPPGGEVPEDYVFDRIGDDGAATTVRMSELFGDNDTLMLYHYMFPRHSGDDRPRPTSGIGLGTAHRRRTVPIVHRADRHVGGHDAPFRRFGWQFGDRCKGPDRAGSGVRTGQGVATHRRVVGGELQFSP
jgi:Bacterial protein of unknown function (DUF899)